MNNLIQENRRAFLLLLSLLFVLLAVIYTLFLRPLSSDRELAEVQVVQLTTDVESLQEQVDEIGEIDSTTDMDIERKKFEKKIPIEPELQNFILSLQEIELISGSKIIDYSFTYDGSIPERQVLEETEVENEEEGSGENRNHIEELDVEIEPEIEGETSPILELPGMPEEVRLVTVTMELYSPNYDRFQEFLQEIEKQERIMMISYLEFEKPGELELLNDEDESIWMNIDVTTFYYED